MFIVFSNVGTQLTPGSSNDLRGSLSISKGSEVLQLGFLATRRGRVKGPSHPGDLSEHRSPGPCTTGQRGSSFIDVLLFLFGTSPLFHVQF